MKRSILPGLMAMIALLSACASHQPVKPISGEAEVEQPTPELELLEKLPASSVVHASEIYSRQPQTLQYMKLDKDGFADEQSLRRREPTEQYRAAFAETDGENQTEYWRVDDHGDIVMPAHINREQNAVSLFDPPLVIAFDELKPNEIETSTASMRVVDYRNADKVKETGKATRTMEYVADQRIRTPLGEFHAKRVEIHFIADLKFADADEKTTLFIAPDVGVVAQQSVVQVKVLGAFGTTRRQTLVLQNRPGGLAKELD